MVIGPQIVGLDVTPEIELIASVGLGMVFLLAGFEIDPAMLFDRPGRLALIALGCLRGRRGRGRGLPDRQWDMSTRLPPSASP